MVRGWIGCPVTEVLKAGGIKIGPFGSQLKKEMLLSDGIYRVYGQENVYEHDFSLGDRFLTKEHFNRLNSCEILPRDFVMSTMGTIGKCAIVPDSIQRGIMDSHLIRLRFDDKKIRSDYMLQLFSDQYHYLSDQTARLAVGGIMDGLSVGIVSRLNVVYPESLEEQERIITILSNTDALITDLKKLIRKKKDIRQGTMQMLVTGKKRLEGYSDEWESTTINSLCKLVTKQTGFDYSAEIKPSLVNEAQIGTLPFIQNKDFEGFDINYNTDFFIPYDVAVKYPKILLDEVCLLISISGRIGNVAKFDNKYKAFAGGAVGIAKFYDPSLVDWCMLYLQSSAGQEQIFSHEKVGAQHNLTVEDVRRLEIKLPKKQEREEIVSIIGDINSEIRKLEEKLSKYQKVKQGMMEELLTGKVRLV
jgi:type I restriction enzyme S subunit